MAPFVVVLVVYLAVRAFWWIGSTPGRLLDPVWIADGALKLLLWVVPCLILVRATLRTTLVGAWHALGLSGSPLPGLVFGAIATLPMAAVVLYARQFSSTVDAVIGTVILGPFAEEVLFRGFMFLGLRHLGWRLISAALVSALAFAVAHAQYASSIVAAWIFGGSFPWLPNFWISVVTLLPFVGIGLVFAWVTHRWQSIWPAIALHAAINLWWELSPATLELASIGRTSLSPLPVAHALSIALAIGLTLRQKNPQVRQVPPVQQIQPVREV